MKIKNLLSWTLLLALGTTSHALAATEHDIHQDFVVTLPAEKQPLLEPLPASTEPGFKFRGIKGWAWLPEQYLAEIPYLVKFKMNFLMNCAVSMWDIENHQVWRDGVANRWWEDLPEKKQQAYEEVVRECQKHNIIFCFSMNPNYWSKRIVNDDSPESIDLLWKHYAWMQGLGVKWFNLSVDDATEGINASSQAKVVNEIFRRLRANDPAAQMIFCPTHYAGDGTSEEHRPYLETLAREIHPDIYFFWTGEMSEMGVGPVGRQVAESYKNICGHRLFLWDNYPANNGQPAMHLGPVIDRDPDLCEIIDGYMSNSMRQQNEINRIPLATCADYAYNPAAYDPARSIGQAIMHLAETLEQRNVLKDLVEAYPGMLITHSYVPGFNAVREQYNRIASAPHSRLAARAYLDSLHQLSARMKAAFPQNYAAEKKTLDNDIGWIEQKFGAQYQVNRSSITHRAAFGLRLSAARPADPR